jgi:hypothetical protein
MDEHLSELREIIPETIADMRRLCRSHLEIVCERVPNQYGKVGCGRIVFAPLKGYNWPAHWHINDIRRKLVCETCKRRYPKVSSTNLSGPNMSFDKWGR